MIDAENGPENGPEIDGFPVDSPSAEDDRQPYEQLDEYGELTPEAVVELSRLDSDKEEDPDGDNGQRQESQLDLDDDIVFELSEAGFTQEEIAAFSPAQAERIASAIASRWDEDNVDITASPDNNTEEPASVPSQTSIPDRLKNADPIKLDREEFGEELADIADVVQHLREQFQELSKFNASQMQMSQEAAARDQVKWFDESISKLDPALLDVLGTDDGYSLKSKANAGDFRAVASLAARDALFTRVHSILSKRPDMPREIAFQRALRQDKDRLLAPKQQQSERLKSRSQSAITKPTRTPKASDNTPSNIENVTRGTLDEIQALWDSARE